jgi:hypothetical protein
MTIQPAETGICWKCGRIFNQQRALVTRFSRMDKLGRGLGMVFAASFTLLLSSLAMLPFYSGALMLAVLITALVLALGSGAYTGWAITQVLAHEKLTRQEIEYESNYGRGEDADVDE